MRTKIRFIQILVLLSGALFLSLATMRASAEPAQMLNGTTVTKIRVNGISAHVFLLDENTQGFAFPTRDEVANTTALDFGYSTPHPTEPNTSIIVQGAGEIPNSAFTIDSTSAHLSLTTSGSYNVTRCTFNEVTGDLICDFDTGIPITFDLTWIANGVGSTVEKIKRTEIFGPFTTKYHADFESRTAIVSGTWGDFSSAEMTGTLMDTGSKTFIREVTVNPNP